MQAQERPVPTHTHTVQETTYTHTWAIIYLSIYLFWNKNFNFILQEYIVKRIVTYMLVLSKVIKINSFPTLYNGDTRREKC